MKLYVTTAEAARELRIAVLERDDGCVAPRLGGSLASVCEGHAEAGMRAGYVWVTDRRNIEALRGYLAAVETHPEEEPA
jgi:hypothetical protein